MLPLIFFNDAAINRAVKDMRDIILYRMNTPKFSMIIPPPRFPIRAPAPKIRADINDMLKDLASAGTMPEI